MRGEFLRRSELQGQGTFTRSKLSTYSSAPNSFFDGSCECPVGDNCFLNSFTRQTCREKEGEKERNWLSVERGNLWLRLRSMGLALLEWEYLVPCFESLLFEAYYALLMLITDTVIYNLLPMNRPSKSIKILNSCIRAYYV